MGLFGSIGRALTGPFRAIGKLVQGKPRDALGAFGDTLKPAAIVASAIPGPHQVATIPLAAAGGALQKFDDEGQRGLGQILMGGAQGATMAAGARALPGLVDKGAGLLGLGGGGGASAPIGSMASTINQNLPSIATQAAGGGGGGGFMGGLGSFIKGNPEVVTHGLGAAADVYGGYQQGKAMDEQLAFEREREDRRMAFEEERERESRRRQELGMLMQAMTSFRPGY